MISDRDIWLSAKAMIQRYGSNAGIEAAERADEAFEKNWRSPETVEWARTFSIVTTDLAIALTPARDNPW